MISFGLLFFITFFSLFMCVLISMPFLLVSLLFLSTSIFSYMWCLSGLTWFPLIFYLLFVGGILILFMMMTSIFSNSKLFNTGFSIGLLVIPLFLFFGCVSWNIMNFKWFMDSGYNFFSTIFLVLFYFFVFIFFLSKEKISMRSYF